MNRLVFCNGLLDWKSDKLLYLLRCGARPGTEGCRNPDRNVRVLPLGHAVVAKPTPHKDTDEQHPRDLWVLNEEPGDVMGFLDSILIAFGHIFVYLRDHLDGLAIFQKWSPDGDNSLSRLDSLNNNSIVMALPHLDHSQG